MTVFYKALLITISIYLMVSISHSTEVNAKEKEGIDINQVANRTFDWVWPVEGRISDYFGSRNSEHHGIDIAAPKGEPVFSVADGYVKKSYYSYTYGNVIFIRHSNGMETVYAHLSSRNVSKGDEVKKEQKIGEVGNTGRSRGNHLHFEVHNGKWDYAKTNAFNPLFALNKSVYYDTLFASKIKQYKEEELLVSLRTTDIYAMHYDVIDKRVPKVDTMISSLLVSNHNEKIDYMKIKVEENDTLWDLSQTYDVAVSSLMKWNNLQSDVIHPGEELKIYSNLEMVHFVKSGETIQQIANEKGADVDEIMRWNNLRKPIVHPSQIIVVQK